MAINDRTIQWNLQVAGAPQAVNDMTSVTGAMASMDDQSRIAATRFTGLASASSALGTVLSRTTPQVGGLASALGTAGGATSGLVTAIGGVGGLVAGGLIAALALSVDWFIRSGEAAEEAKDAWLEAGLAALTAAKSVTELDKARAKSAREAMDLETEADLIEDINRLNEEKNEKQKESLELQRDTNEFLEEENQEKFKTLTAEISSLGTLARKKQTQLDTLRVSNDQLDMGEAILELETEIEERKKKQLKTTKAIKNEWKDLIKTLSADGEVTDLLEIFDPEEAEDKFAQLTLHEEAYYDARMQRMQEFLAEQKKLEEEGAAAFEKAWQGSLSIVGSATTDLAADMLAGNEVSLANILNMMGTQIIKDGIKNLWVAGGMLLNPITAGSGGALMGYAAAEIAAGTAMAQASGGAGGASSGGPGGAGGGSSGMAPARPTPVAQGILDKRKEESTVIHVHTLTPTVEAGEAIDRAWIAARTKRGKYAMGMKA